MQLSIQMEYLLKKCMLHKASDLHIKAKQLPYLRVSGKLVPASNTVADNKMIAGFLKDVLAPSD